ncbi:MAG: hypothetical protein R3C19_22040 [Planctomycetaceae bacterium]
MDEPHVRAQSVIPGQLRAAALVTAMLLSGCLSMPARQAPVQNALVIPAGQFDLMWERSVAVLNNYHFMVARESKLEGLIETHYRAGSNLFEPWNPDSADTANRLESTLQSIRRRVIVQFQNTSADSMTVIVRVEKQIEDVPGLAANYEGGASFPESDPLDRDLNQVLGQSTPSRWISRGTDPALESKLIRDIQQAVLQ